MLSINSLRKETNDLILHNIKFILHDKLHNIDLYIDMIM